MKNRPLMCLCFAICGVILLGILVGKERFVQELRPSPLEQHIKEGEAVATLGTVYKKEIKAEHQILYLKNNSISYQQQVLQEFKLMVYDNTMKPIDIGNKVLVKGEAALMQPALNPGNFNEKRYWQRQNIHAKIWADSVTVTESTSSIIMNRLFQFRQKWKQALYECVGQRDGAVMSGIILGDKTDMDADMKELYQTNGIGHILAISGLHLSFVGLGIYQFLRRVSGSFRVGGLGGITFLLCYILMIGFTVSAVRALVMFLFRVGADMSGRRYDAWTAFAAALATVIVWRPLYIYDGGFWLSFGAVLGALMVVPLLKDLPVQGFWASVGINITILPVLLYFFYEFPVYSVFLNILVIPLLSVLLFLGIAGSALFIMSPIVGEGVLKVCQVILWIYEQCCNIALKLPGARVITGQPALWSVITYYIILAVIVIIIINYRKKARKLLLIIMCMNLFVLLYPSFRIKEGALGVTVLDVGQGDGLFIQDPERNTYLIDGGSTDVKQVGKYRIEPFLKWKGIRQLDYVFVSHGDADHTNGILELLERRKTGVPIRNLVLPPQSKWNETVTQLVLAAKKAKTKVFVMEDEEVLSKGTIKFTCLHPGSACTEEAGNAASMVLEVAYKEFELLLTGDVEGVGEKHLTEVLQERAAQPSVDVLKVAHHGSKNSSTLEFLETVQPAYALISAGKHNRYGHPHEETIEKLKKIGCDVYSTQERGAIEIITDGHRMKISQFLTD